jgi:multidrug efflux system outer membrane protein
MKAFKLFAPSLLIMALAACTVGPDYKTPDTPPAQLQVGPAASYDRSHFETVWWQQFDDPTLNALVGVALDSNRDLKVAFARWKAARAIRDDVSNDALPVVTSRASSQIGRAQVPGNSDHRVNIERYDLGLDMAWEIDLFGRIQRQLEASNAQQDAAAADFFQLRVTMIAELADAYGQLRGAQLREKIARANLKNQTDSKGVTVSRREEGIGNELDVVRADARLAAVEATIPQLQAEQVRHRNRIATLLGERPDQMSVDLAPANLPAISKALPIGNVGELLQRRPDILAADRRLAAATANIGVNTADLFPRVTLSGFLGFTAARGSQIGSGAAQAWGLGPSITWAAFDLGSVKARIRGANAEAEVAMSSYEQQVLLALEESSNAFSDYSKRQERLVSLIRQSNSSRAAADIAGLQYKEGTADYLVLLDAERERLNAEDAQALGETEQYRSIVAIYKALGGGWDAGSGSGVSINSPKG